jgi:hypothetical protein
MIQESESPHIPKFFDDQGKYCIRVGDICLIFAHGNVGRWISSVPIPPFSLEDYVTAIPAGEEKDMFIRFMRRILKWEAWERAVSSDLLADPWQIPPGE